MDTTEGIRRAEYKTFIEKIKRHTEVLNKVLQDSQDIWIRIRSSVRSGDYDSLDGEDLSKALRTAMKLEKLMAVPSGCKFLNFSFTHEKSYSRMISDV